MRLNKKTMSLLAAAAMLGGCSASSGPADVEAQLAMLKAQVAQLQQQAERPRPLQGRGRAAGRSCRRPARATRTSRLREGSLVGADGLAWELERPILGA